MSLFPAYGQESVAGSNPAPREEGSAVPGARWDIAEPAESELLASSDSEPEPPREPAPLRAAPEPDYYVDRRFDGGNLRVSTIYYPGRPEYKSLEEHLALGARGGGRKRKKRARRYWQAAPEPQDPHPAPAEEPGERGEALRRALRERPGDEALWLQYVDYQERVAGAGAALSAAEAGAARLPRSGTLRRRRLAAARRALSAGDLVALLRDELAREKEPRVAAELWRRLVAALARTPAAGVPGATAAAAAAARQLARLPRAYPELLYTYGTVVRAAGLWETLVLLLELLGPLVAPGAAFPPPRDPAAEPAAERDLDDYEDEVARSGLPGAATWARVERRRAAAHWRPAPAQAQVADPQRAPELADVADLLLPAADPLPVLATALRLAKVPLFPGAEHVAHAVGAGEGGEEWDAGEALLVAVRAARRLPRAHPARLAPAHARALLQLLVDPPHYFSDDYGYRSWVESLWDAALAAAAGGGAGGGGGGAGAQSALAQLLGWRMSWLHSQLLLLEDSPKLLAEARRIRDAAQASLRRYGGSLALPFAQFARVAHAYSAVAHAHAGAGLRAATVALRAALLDPGVPQHQLLYIARIVWEVSEDAAAGACAVACAVLRRALPADLRAPPDLLRDASEEVERRCAELEAELEAEDGEGGEEGEDGDAWVRWRRAQLPGEAEWACARALLASASRRAALLRHALTQPAGLGRGRAARWREQEATTLALHAPGAAPAARALAARYPHNVLLALMAGSTPWWRSAGVAGCAGVPGVAGGSVQALGRVWVALAGAARADWAPAAAGRLARQLRRELGGEEGEGSALLWALWLEAEARAPRPRLERAALQAADALPHHKWLLTRGAALGAAGAGALPDALLERGLRLHALPDELRAPTPPSHPSTGCRDG